MKAEGKQQRYDITMTRLRHFDTPQEALASMLKDVTLFMDETTERMVNEATHYTEDDFLDLVNKRFDYDLIREQIGFVGGGEPQAPSAEAPEGEITITITKEEAERLSYGLSDLSCWAAGFRAALGDDDIDRYPMGVEAARGMNSRLKRAMDEAEKGGEE